MRLYNIWRAYLDPIRQGKWDASQFLFAFLLQFLGTLLFLLRILLVCKCKLYTGPIHNNKIVSNFALHVLLMVVTKFVYNIWYRHPPDSAGVDEVCPGAGAEELPDHYCEGGEEACIVLYCTVLHVTALYCTEHDGEDDPVLPRQRGQPAPAAALSHPLRWRWRGVQTSANWTCIVLVFVWPTKICASFS